MMIAFARTFSSAGSSSDRFQASAGMDAEEQSHERLAVIELMIGCATATTSTISFALEGKIKSPADQHRAGEQPSSLASNARTSRRCGLFRIPKTAEKLAERLVMAGTICTSEQLTLPSRPTSWPMPPTRYSSHGQAASPHSMHGKFRKSSNDLAPACGKSRRTST